VYTLSVTAFTDFMPNEPAPDQLSLAQGTTLSVYMHVLDTCESDAVPDAGVEASWPAPMLCQSPAGLCYTLGLAEPRGQSFQCANDALLAQPIVPPVDGRLTMLGLVAAASMHSGGGYLSLHADEDHQPGRLINRSSSRGFVPGVNLFPTVSLTLPSVALTRGTRYWLVLNVWNAGGDDPLLFVAPAGAAGSMRQGTRPFEPPSTLAPGATAPGTGQLSLFARVEE